MAFQSMKKDVSHGVEEVTFKNHISEFQRFYTNHKSFCDEVAGIRPRTIIENNESKEFYITKDNYIFAIRKLLAFVIDNIHYIKQQSDRKIMWDECFNLEKEFLNDTDYQNLARKQRTKSEEIILTKKYIRYIMTTYEIGNKLALLLQNSLMIATSRVSKDVEYHNESAFFDELSKYRTEICDSISNYRFSDTLLQFKKILGYYYTYRILLREQEQEFIQMLLEQLVEELLQENMIKLMEKVAQGNHLINEEREFMSQSHDIIRRILLKIYAITNKNLSERKILPKIMKKVHVDKTLI